MKGEIPINSCITMSDSIGKRLWICVYLGFGYIEWVGGSLEGPWAMEEREEVREGLERKGEERQEGKERERREGREALSQYQTRSKLSLRHI